MNPIPLQAPRVERTTFYKTILSNKVNKDKDAGHVKNFRKCIRVSLYVNKFQCRIFYLFFLS